MGDRHDKSTPVTNAPAHGVRLPTRGPVRPLPPSLDLPFGYWSLPGPPFVTPAPALPNSASSPTSTSNNRGVASPSPTPSLRWLSGRSSGALPIFSSTGDRVLDFSVLVPATGHYMLVIDNSGNQDPRAVSIDLKASYEPGAG